MVNVTKIPNLLRPGLRLYYSKTYCYVKNKGNYVFFGTIIKKSLDMIYIKYDHTYTYPKPECQNYRDLGNTYIYAKQVLNRRPILN